MIFDGTEFAIPHWGFVVVSVYIEVCGTRTYFFNGSNGDCVTNSYMKPEFVKDNEQFIAGTRKCGICEVEKPYHFIDLAARSTGQSQARFVDDQNRQWGKGRNKGVCPDCRTFLETTYKRLLKEMEREIKESQIYKLSCHQCHKEFESVKEKKFCSKQCRDKNRTDKWNKIRSEQRIRKTVENTCQECDTIFIRKVPSRFCSINCRVKHKHRTTYVPKPRKVKEPVVKTPKPPSELTCKECGSAFISKISTKEYCSKRCWKRCARREGREKVYKPSKAVARASRKKREMAILKRIPKWANIKELDRIYKEKPANVHVDHIIPLRGELVSGLHVEYNLQYLSPEENIFKNAKFDGTYDNLSWKDEFEKYRG
jgi:hypothetical protein